MFLLDFRFFAISYHDFKLKDYGIYLKVVLLHVYYTSLNSLKLML